MGMRTSNKVSNAPRVAPGLPARTPVLTPSPVAPALVARATVANPAPVVIPALVSAPAVTTAARKRGRPFKAGTVPVPRRPAHVRAHDAVQHLQARIEKLAKTFVSIHAATDASEEHQGIVSILRQNMQNLQDTVQCLFVDLETLISTDFKVASRRTTRRAFTPAPGVQVAIKAKYYSEAEMGDNNDLAIVSVGERMVTLRHENSPKASQLKLPLSWIEAASTALARATRQGALDVENEDEDADEAGEQ